MSTRTFLAVVAALFLAAPVQAAVISVSTPDPGSAVADDGQCSLPEAIRAANTNTPSGAMEGECPAGHPDPAVDTIVLSDDVTLTTALPWVDTAIRIEGSGHTVGRSSASGTPEFSIFWVEGLLLNGDLTLRDLTVTNGRGGTGGGGIVNLEGRLTLTNTTVSGNDALAWGGGILNAGRATITNSTIEGNTVWADYPFPYSVPAASGGGIANINPFTETIPILMLTNSTVSGNHACCGRRGGRNSPASYASGGGISTYGTVMLTNSTVSGNSVGGEVLAFDAGIEGEATLTNSIVANESTGDHTNCSGPSYITDNGGNFSDDASCGAGFAAITPGVDFDTTLADNGGPTPTHALLHGSPAIDAIPPEDCTYDDDGDPGTPEVPLTEDQRGVARPLTGDGAPPTGCDAGAYEVTQCADGLHNDADGRIDFDGGVTAGLPPEEQTEPDLQCFGPTDTREKSRCGLGYELVLVLAVLLGRRHVAAQATVTSR